MTPIHKRRTTCRLCNSADVEQVFALESCPLAEGYAPPAEAHKFDQRYPLDVFLCRACGGVQLLDVIDAGHLFRDYAYTSEMSPDLDDHFERYAKDVCERFKPDTGSLVVDIGSNSGLLLRKFKLRGMTVLGVEPAKKIAWGATESGVMTVADFMTPEVGRDIAAFCGHAKIVCANNVLAHAEEPGVILDGVREVLADDGVFVFEVSYLPDLLENLVFDWCYHEHGIFYTLDALTTLLRKHGLSLFDAELVPTKGGSIRCYAAHPKANRSIGKGWCDLIDEECESGPPPRAPKWDNPAIYRDFIVRVNALREQTVSCLREYERRNLPVAGYGASATTTVLLHHFKVGGLLDYLVDDNAKRWGLVSPGYRLPVLDSSALRDKKSSAVFINAWRFADKIMDKNKAYLDAGGAFIVPLPTFKEVAGG